jgi:hypothetical protein
MTAALIFQFVSLLVSVAMVPLLLGFLGAGEFLVWSVILVISGLSMQLEQAIQTLSVRRVATLLGPTSKDLLDAELRRTTAAYRKLALLMLVVVGPLGWAYMDLALFRTDPSGPPEGWELAWGVTVAALTANYWFGRNNVLLMATGRTDSFFRINTLSRCLNFLLVIGAAASGLGLAGVGMAFAMAALVGVSIIAAAAARPIGFEPLTAVGRAPLALEGAEKAGILRYIGYTLAAYLLYRGAFLLAAGFYPVGESSSYGLALQAFVVMAATAVVPTHVRLPHLVEAMKSGPTIAIDQEVGRTLVFAVGVLLVGTIVLLAAGPPVLKLIKSAVTLPDTLTVALMATAILVECLIVILINPMLLQKDLSFVRPYVVSAMIAMAATSAAAVLGWPLWVAMLLLPLIVQASFAGPTMLRRYARMSGGRGPLEAAGGLALGTSLLLRSGRFRG